MLGRELVGVSFITSVCKPEANDGDLYNSECSDGRLLDWLVKLFVVNDVRFMELSSEKFALVVEPVGS